MKSIEETKKLAIWVVDLIGTHKAQVLTAEKGADWDWIASRIWATYPGIVNEFMINDAIDFIVEAADSQYPQQ